MSVWEVDFLIAVLTVFRIKLLFFFWRIVFSLRCRSNLINSSVGWFFLPLKVGMWSLLRLIMCRISADNRSFYSPIFFRCSKNRCFLLPLVSLGSTLIILFIRLKNYISRTEFLSFSGSWLSYFQDHPLSFPSTDLRTSSIGCHSSPKSYCQSYTLF